MTPRSIVIPTSENKEPLGLQPERLDKQNRILCMNLVTLPTHVGNPGIALDQFDWGHPSEFEIKWLTKREVSLKALLGDWPIGATNAAFDNHGHFVTDKTGERVLTFVAFNAGVPIDVVAWQPKTGQTATHLGTAAFLGDQDDAINPATWLDGEDLLIHASPLEWLQHDRNGLVIVNFKMAGAYLRNARSVFCEDVEIAKKLRKAVRASSTPTLQIYTSASARERGARNA